MEKYLKLLVLLIIITLTFVNVVFAEEPESVPPTGGSLLETAKTARSNYCSKGQDVKGCLYNNYIDKFETISGFLEIRYARDNKAGIIPDGDPSRWYIPFNYQDVELTRGYQAFDGNGNAVFAGCYRYVLDKDLVINSDLQMYISKGTYFIFKIFLPYKSGKCDPDAIGFTFAIPSSGTKAHKIINVGNGSDLTIEFDGVMGLDKAVQEHLGNHTNGYAELRKWVALDGGDCPKIFGYTVNSTVYTSASHTYMFSEDKSDYKSDMVEFVLDGFFSKKKVTYTNVPGCTTVDVDGQARNEELLSEITKEIDNTTCPDKVDDLISFHKRMETWYDDLVHNNEYRVLYSKGLIDETTVKNNEEKIRDAMAYKLTKCHYSICELTPSEVDQLDPEDTCSNGCSLHNVNVQSDSKDAKCYCCSAGGSQDCTYRWTDTSTDPLGIASCSLQQETKSNCIGTSTDKACRDCLNKAYNGLGSSEEQKAKAACLIGTELAKEVTIYNLTALNRAAASLSVKKEIEENEKWVEEQLSHTIKDFNFKYHGISDDLLTCEELLGPIGIQVVKGIITLLQIVAAIIAVVKATLLLLPAVAAHDAEALKAASKKLITLAIVLVLVLLFRPIVSVLGNALDFDVSCLI